MTLNEKWRFRGNEACVLQQRAWHSEASLETFAELTQSLFGSVVPEAEVRVGDGVGHGNAEVMISSPAPC